MGWAEGHGGVQIREWPIDYLSMRIGGELSGSIGELELCATSDSDLKPVEGVLCEMANLPRREVLYSTVLYSVFGRCIIGKLGWGY
jgi:hypothetical protein